MAKSSSISRTAVWILLGLLIIGLAGFGATNVGGNIRSIGSVGEKQISTQSYFTAVQRELSNLQEQTGQVLSFGQMRDLGLDRAVLQRLITLRALDNEASEMGLSIGDENVRDQVLDIPAFQGLDGSFDRESYNFALERQGLTEGEFETSLREETARTLLQGAITNGITMPQSFADTLVSYAGEQRDFTWARLQASSLEVLPEAANDAELRAFYDENTDRFMLPETKQITFAWLTPEMLVDQVDLDDDALRQAYQDRLDEFARPERRFVERLVYLDEESANRAGAALDAGGSTFEFLVEERGLTLGDIDLGDVGRLELDAAGEAVFAAESGEVVGPLPTSLGPALFRVNGVIPALSISYEEALPQLRESAALDRASRIVDQQADNFDDLLAGGATLEELAAESDMQLGTIDWSVESSDGIAAYDSFRAAAAALTTNDFPAIAALDDGGLFAMRLDEELPARPEPFEQARESVETAVAADRTRVALMARGEELLAQVSNGADPATLGLTAIEETERTRGAFVSGAPSALIDEVFAMSPGEAKLVSGDGMVTLVRLDAIAPVSDSAEAQQLRSALQTRLNQTLAQDIFDIFTNDVALRGEPRIDQRAVEAVNANFQ